MNERKSQTKSRVSCVIRVQCPKTPPMHTAQLHNFLHHYKYCVFKMPTLPPPNLLPFTPNSASASLIFYVGVLGTLYSGQINIGGPLTFVVVAFSSFLNVFPFEKISLETPPSQPHFAGYGCRCSFTHLANQPIFSICGIRY